MRSPRSTGKLRQAMPLTIVKMVVLTARPRPRTNPTPAVRTSLAAHHPQCAANVEEQRVDQRQPSLLAIEDLDLIDAAERAPRRELGFGIGHAGGSVVFGKRLEVVLDFCVEACFAAFSQYQIKELREENPNPGSTHGVTCWKSTGGYYATEKMGQAHFR